MISLGQDNIRLHVHATDKVDAIRQVGNLLGAGGYIRPGYTESMLARERVTSSYLGRGIALAHGLDEDCDLIERPGVSVVQIPGGVEWNPGEVVHLVVGVAGGSQEYRQVLSTLMALLEAEPILRDLQSTDDPIEILERLTGPYNDKGETAAPKDESGFSTYADLTIREGTGLHARPAAVFARIAKRFDAEIRVRRGAKTADGKSVISLLQLGAERGARIRIMAHGADADAAIEALAAAVDSGLGDHDEVQSAPTSARPRRSMFEGTALPGSAASPGLAIGPLFRLRHRRLVVAATAIDPVAEGARFKQAVEAARAQLDQLHDEVERRLDADKAGIFRAHAAFLEDPDMLDKALEHIKSGHSAGWAWERTCEEWAAALERLGDPRLAARAGDLRDVGRRVLSLLAEPLDDEPNGPDRPVILVTDDLSPSDTARLDPALALGICTAAGGPTSHSAIIARSLGIPAVVGAGPAVLQQAEGIECILDGDGGFLVVAPTETDLLSARETLRDLRTVREAERRSCHRPAIMTDGHQIGVVANIGTVAEAERAVRAGAEGVGLLRTEVLFLERTEPPGEDEQFEAYREITRALAGRPLIIRTLDIGGDKQAPYLALPAEDNPFLGLRGIRLCLARPELFRPQLRAIFRVAATGPVKLMFPMITTFEDLAAARTISEQVRLELGAKPVEIGMMVEVPAAVLMADGFATEIDFFSVGTNDLTQYTLAIDRLHPVLARQADALHPAVLRMIDRTVRAAKTAGKWVGVCGGIAADPIGAAILAGLGVAELSVAIPSIAAVKARIRTLSLRETRALARRALACRSAAEVRAL